MPNGIYQQSFWDDEGNDLWQDLAETMLEIYLSGIDGGVDALPPNLRVLADFDHVNVKALEFAKNYHYDWIRKITETTRQQTQKAVSDWIQSGAPLSALETSLERVYGAARAERIAVTEVTRVFACGNQDAWESTGLVEEMEIRNAADDLVCPTCSPLGGTHVGIGDIDALPPFHISCRCWVQPVVSEDALARKLDEDLGL